MLPRHVVLGFAIRQAQQNSSKIDSPNRAYDPHSTRDARVGDLKYIVVVTSQCRGIASIPTHKSRLQTRTTKTVSFTIRQPDKMKQIQSKRAVRALRWIISFGVLTSRRNRRTEQQIDRNSGNTMKKLFALSGILLSIASPALCLAQQTPAQPPTSTLAAVQPNGTTILVPAGTPIPVHVVGVVSSKDVKEGDTFQIQAAKDVVVNGLIVVRAGSLGSGTIGNVEHAGGNGHSGALTLNFEWIYAADGGKVRLSQATQKQAEEDRKGASSTATIIGVATFGIGGLFGHNLAHGREVTVDDKKVLNAFVADNVHITASETATTEHFDH
jgi:hypothetical protein